MPPPRRILKLAKEEIILRADLAEKQEVLSELLAGLQRLEQNPPPALVVEPDDVLAALRGAMMFGTIVPELRGEAEILARTDRPGPHPRRGEKEKSDVARLHWKPREMISTGSWPTRSSWSVTVPDWRPKKGAPAPWATEPNR